MKNLYLSEKSKEVLNYILVHRIVTFSELKSVFYPEISRQAAMKNLKNLVQSTNTFLEFREQHGRGRGKFVVAKPIAGTASTYQNHDLIVANVRRNFSEDFPKSIWISEFEIRLNIKNGFDFKFPYFPDGCLVFAEKIENNIQTVGIEVEVSLKNKKRIRERLINLLDPLSTKVDRFLIFTTNSLVFKSYESILSEILKKQRKNSSIIRLINLDKSFFFEEDFRKKIEEIIK